MWAQPDHAQAREEACGKRTRGSAGGRANSSSVSEAGEPWSAMVSGSWSAMTTASGSWSAMTTAREERKPLTNQGTTLQKTVVRRSRGETDALANSDAGEIVQLNSSRQPTGVNTNIWMILVKRSQKSGPTAGRRADLQRVEERTYSW